MYSEAGGNGRPKKPRVIWEPNPGSQTRFLTCPYWEVFLAGTRAGGKTDVFLMDFAQDTGAGWGIDWRGILFRRTYKQLSDVVARSRKWFSQIFPGATFNKSDMTWTWETGEELLLRYMNRPEDYWEYHGHQYSWLGFEELPSWPSPECYDLMKSCCRSSRPRMPRKLRANGNPFGPGHGWVKHRFIDAAPPGKAIEEKIGEITLKRCWIFSHWSENRHVVENDPEAIAKLQADPNENRRKAWAEGDWDIVAGGMFDDLWDRGVHAIPRFKIPKRWRIFRAFDWGSSKPFSVGWYAEANGEDVTLLDGSTRSFPRGTRFRIAEWYGWNGEPNKGCRMTSANVARGILEREDEMGVAGRVSPGPADTSIFDVDAKGTSIADDMERLGVKWERAQKGPGSRVNGWEKLRELLEASLQVPMEEPGFFVFEESNTHFLRTFPVAQRSDKNPDDVNTESEDHILDEVRYALTSEIREFSVGSPGWM